MPCSSDPPGEAPLPWDACPPAPPAPVRLFWCTSWQGRGRLPSLCLWQSVLPPAASPSALFDKTAKHGVPHPVPGCSGGLPWPWPLPPYCPPGCQTSPPPIGPGAALSSA
eukprot:1482811-Ditylum_brightwellii.AAC.1